MDSAGMYAPLSDREVDSAGAGSRKRASKVPIVPVPADAPPMAFKHPKLGAPSRSWPYHAADGRLAGYVCRWDFVDAEGKPAKEILPVTYCDLGGERFGWRSKGIPAPRPLHSLPGILSAPNRVVIVAEGEKARDAAQVLFPSAVATTPAHGAKSPQLTDFTPLAGRVVIVAPDHDEPGRTDDRGQPLHPGRDFGDRVAALAREAGAAAVLRLAPDTLGTSKCVDGLRVSREGTLPDGWDLADALDEGWTAERVATAIPDLRALPTYPAQVAPPNPDGDAESEGSRWPFRIVPHGVEKRVDQADRESGESTVSWRWFCSPLSVLAETRGTDGEDWGRLLEIVDRDGRTKQWALPMAMMAGDGAAYRERLLSLGLVMSPGKFARDALHEYITTARPDSKARSVSRIGWHGRTFAWISENYGGSGEHFILQVKTKVDHAYRRAGTLDDWREKVARLARGNSRLIFAISAAFAPPLLHPAAAEGGGIHFLGNSSTGKTTALLMAGSVWGGGEINGYLRTWRSSSNGVEGIAAVHCDTLLCLDEISQVAPHEVGGIAYMLANGLGKSRASQSGEARPVARWRSLFLSSGEVSLAQKMAEDGRGRQTQAGQEVRIVDVMADAGAGYGLFEDLHGFKDGGALSDHLRLATSQYYGTAAPAFLERITKAFDEIQPRVARYRDRFLTEHCPQGADGQVDRVAKRFALVAAAGEMATAFGIVPWKQGEATRAAATCFSSYVSTRGGIGPAEEQRALAHVRRLIEIHGSSRFEPLGDLIPVTATGTQIEQRVPNRLGFRKKVGDGIQYIILPETWASEICTGYNKATVIKVLRDKGFLEIGKDGKAQVNTWLPPLSKSPRCYIIKGDILDDEPDDTPAGEAAA